MGMKRTRERREKWLVSFFLSRRDSDDECFLSLPINKHQLEHETVQRSMIKFKLFVTIPIREGIVKNGTKCLSHAYLF